MNFYFLYKIFLLTDKNNTAELEFETNKNSLSNMSVESIKENILFEGNLID